jgi:hypothetical protein
MLLEVIRFNRTASAAVTQHAGATLAELAKLERYSERLVSAHERSIEAS